MTKFSVIDIIKANFIKFGIAERKILHTLQ